MTRERRFKALIRKRMQATGESFTAARAGLERDQASVLPQAPDESSTDSPKGNPPMTETTNNVPAVESTVPILPVLDLDESEGFYARLGFETTARYDSYSILKRGDVELHLTLTPGMDPTTTASQVYVRVADAGSLYDSLHAGLEADGLLVQNPPGALTLDVQAELERRTAAGEKHIRLHEIQDTDYGMREFAVIDPSGNGVRLGQRLDP